MAIDREALKKQIKQQQAKRAGGFVQYIKKDEARQVRILGFVRPEDGEDDFARTVVHFRSADGKTTYLDRAKTFGAACVPTRLEEMAAECGEDSPFQRRQTQYYMNGIDIDKQPHKVQIWGLPTSVWEAIATMLLSDEWQDILDPNSGHYFVITRSGDGLDTKYDVTPSRKPWPVSDALLKQAKDPYSGVKDTGLAGQCEELGVTVEALWPDGTEGLEQIDPIDTGNTETAAPEATPAKKPPGKIDFTSLPPVKPKPAAPAVSVAPEPVEEDVVTFVEGTRIKHTETGRVGVVVSVSDDGENVEAELDDEPSEAYEIAISEIVLEEAESEVEIDDSLPVIKKSVAKVAAKPAPTAKPVAKPVASSVARVAAAKLGGKSVLDKARTAAKKK